MVLTIPKTTIRNFAQTHNFALNHGTVKTVPYIFQPFRTAPIHNFAQTHNFALNCGTVKTVPYIFPKTPSVHIADLPNERDYFKIHIYFYIYIW
ncbi:MAG: hypothetical protein RR162_03910 [Oscillospiraceae bacterium]